MFREKLNPGIPDTPAGWRPSIAIISCLIAILLSFAVAWALYPKPVRLTGNTAKEGVSDYEREAVRDCNLTGSSQNGRPQTKALRVACEKAADERQLQENAYIQARRSSDASEAQALYAFGQLRISAVGAGLGLVTMLAAIAAAIYAGRAAHHTRRGADFAKVSSESFVKVEDASLLLAFPNGHAVTGTADYYSLRAYLSNIGRSAALIHDVQFGNGAVVFMNTVLAVNESRSFDDWVHVEKRDGEPSALTTTITYSTALRDRATIVMHAAVLLDPKDKTPWAFVTSTEWKGQT